MNDKRKYRIIRKYVLIFFRNLPCRIVYIFLFLFVGESNGDELLVFHHIAVSSRLETMVCMIIVFDSL